MATVYFTREITAQTKSAGEELLGWYWRASKLSKAPYYPITNWEGLKSYLNTNYPTYIEYLGTAGRDIDRDKLIEAMKLVAANGKTSYPRPSDFSNAIMQVAGKVNYLETIKEGAAEAVEAISDYSRYALYAVLAIAAIAAFFAIYSRTGGKMPKLPKLPTKIKLA